MAEKRGGTEKIIFDFDTTNCMEVLIDKWYRVTASEFRAFDGRRRLTYPTSVTKSVVDVEMETREYYGPVYLYATNIEVNRLDLNTVVRDLEQHTKFK